MIGQSIALSLRLLGRSADHTIRAIMGFAWIIAIIIATSGIITGFTVTIFGLTGQVGYSNRFTIRPINSDQEISREIIERLYQGDFIEIVPLAKRTVSFSSNEKTLQTQLIGTNLTALTGLLIDSKIIEGRLPEANQTPIECLQGIEVSSYLTTNISYHIHDGTQFGSCEIVGTISGIAELQQTIIVHLEDYLTMIGEPLTRVSYNEVKVKTREALTLSEIKNELVDILNDDYQKLLVWNEQQTDIFTETLIRDILSKLEVLFIILFVIALVRLFHSISWFTITYERTFLIMRTIGLPKEGLFLLMIILGQVVGNVGFVSGVILGYALPPIVLSIISTIFGVSFLVTEFPITNIISLWLVSIIMITLATIVPSLKISRTPPAKISILIKEQ